MSNFLISTFANGLLANMKSLSNKLNEDFQAFEFSDIDDAFKKAEKRMKKSLKKLNKRFKTKDGKLEINIPYDRVTDTLVTTIEDDMFTAKVTRDVDGETSERETSIYLDETVIIDSMVRQYDAEKKLMYFTFDKSVDLEQQLEEVNDDFDENACDGGFEEVN